jgi:hypothetical protein
VSADTDEISHMIKEIVMNRLLVLLSNNDRVELPSMEACEEWGRVHSKGADVYASNYQLLATIYPDGRVVKARDITLRSVSL